MRSFGLVDDKLEEARFFLERFQECGWKLFEARCYFNAFVSSTRSVTFAVQASLNGLEGAAEWYGDWQGKLRASQLARFFHNCRTDIQHVGKNYIVGGVSGPDGPRLLLGHGSFERREDIPEVDAFVATRLYFQIVCSVVRDAYATFPYAIDPDKFYTVEGLAHNGLTLEDVEADLGFPRGYVTGLPLSGFSDEEVLGVLRKHAAISNCRHILDAVAEPPDEAWD